MFENSLILDQRQCISTGQLQSLEILAYTNQELNDFMSNEYLENPLLDRTSDKQDESLENLEKLYESGTTYQEHSRKWGEEDTSRKGDVPARKDDGHLEFVFDQLYSGDYSKREWQIITYLIHCMDEHGFFTYDTCEIAQVFHCSEETVNGLLGVLKNLKPAGIFSKSLEECLKKQLEEKGMQDQKLFDLIDHHLPDILTGHLAIVSRSLGISTARVKKYIRLIGELNPRPVMDLQMGETQYIIPDIIVTYNAGEWNIHLNDKWMGEFHLNEYYVRMMKTAEDSSLKEYFRSKYERARYIMNCIEQRRTTILKITEAIIHIQEDYFLKNGSICPMSMEEIAEKIGVHASTVSRAIKGKYLQYRKTVLLRDLFTQSSSTIHSVSTDMIERKLIMLVEKENTGHPLSDQKIVDVMKEEGIDISRRTVTKYRIRLGIPDSRQRGYLS